MKALKNKELEEAIENQEFLRQKAERAKARGEDFEPNYDSVGRFEVFIVDSLLRLLRKEEINQQQYRLGVKYYNCFNFFRKTKGSSIEVVDGGGGNASTFFAARADAAKFVVECEKLCEGALELRMLQRVCGDNESLRNASGGTTGHKYRRSFIALINILKKMHKHFGNNYC